ncbi:unnamed protein product [Rotaria sordida]|uniref:NHL repeat-containing protein n=1 Tax=Rotaria sordida TaxID=392033 RepID=A0A819T076_9BILA|nr:unnamed protein product [Rotaria sordida]CAF4072523.1 unnamed protein product [Rotaria sordida]
MVIYLFTLSLFLTANTFVRGQSSITLAVCPTASWNSNGTIIAGVNGQGSAFDQLNCPTDIALTSSLTLYVTDHYNNRTLQFSNGSSMGMNIPGGSTYYSPTSLFLDLNDNLYINDFGNNLIKKLSTTNIISIVAAVNTSGGIFVDVNQNIYYSCSTNHHVIEQTLSGATRRVAGNSTRGSSLSQLDTPAGIYLDSNSSMYIADMNNHRVIKWLMNATSGVIVAGGNGPGTALNQLNTPTFVLVDQYGTVYVSETFNNRVTKWLPGSSTGIVIAGGSAGTALNQLYTNYGIKFDATGNLYVADCASYRVLKYQIINPCSVSATVSTTVVSTGNNE